MGGRTRRALTRARGRDVSAPRVRQHRAVAHHAHADLVGTAFEPQHGGHGGRRGIPGAGLVGTGTTANSLEPSDGACGRQK